MVEITCDHVEKMINQMKATDLDTGEQGERRAFYMYMTGSDDSGTNTCTAEKYRSSDERVNQRRFTLNRLY